MPTRRRKAEVKDTPQDTDVEIDAQIAEHVPDVFEVGYEAHRLRVAGVPWRDIADKLGSASVNAVMIEVTRYLQRAAANQSASQMQEAMQTQIDRYETILHEWWEAGTTGRDEKAALVVLRTMERLDRILRLTDGDVVVAKETLVVSANPDEYIKQLQGVVEQRAVEKSNGRQ